MLYNAKLNLEQNHQHKKHSPQGQAPHGQVGMQAFRHIGTGKRADCSYADLACCLCIAKQMCPSCLSKRWSQLFSRGHVGKKKILFETKQALHQDKHNQHIPRCHAVLPLPLVKLLFKKQMANDCAILTCSSASFIKTMFTQNRCWGMPEVPHETFPPLWSPPPHRCMQSQGSPGRPWQQPWRASSR